MQQPLFDTIDDAMRSMYSSILKNGTSVTSSKGENIEMMAMGFTLSNPRNRISRTEARGKIISCLGELSWYLSGSDRLSDISYYIRDYKDMAKDGILPGAYGPRLFGDNGQWMNIVSLLARKASTRQAVIQLFRGDDLLDTENEDVPCTCTLQFLYRDSRLNLIVYMRSNDAYKGLAHDVFCFTMLQEMMCGFLGFEIGSYCHIAGSMHIYKKDLVSVDRFLQEGYQPSTRPMPDMPAENIGPSVIHFYEYAKRIKDGNFPTEKELEHLHVYWRQLLDLLKFYKLTKMNQPVDELVSQFVSTVYYAFIEDRVRNAK